MAFIQTFGRYLPERVLTNEELARTLGVEPAWIFRSSGIGERRIAAPDESIHDLGAAAARDCLTRADSPQIGMLIVSSGTLERRFPGPAAEIAHRLGLTGVPAIDLPIASAGSVFAIALATSLAPRYGRILIVAAEKMAHPAADKNTAILFGDGAGACLISANGPGLEILDSSLHSDGAFSSELHLEFEGPVRMNGMAVIRQATVNLPSVLQEVLARTRIPADAVRTFLMHQANQNLMDRVARALNVPADRFYSNIRLYGNTSSASMLIAASEWSESARLSAGDPVCFAAFGAGFHWGAALARQS